MSDFTVFDKTEDDTRRGQCIEKSINVLVYSESKLTEKDRKRLKNLCGNAGNSAGAVEPFKISHLDELYAITKKMLQEVVDDRHEILSDASLRDISSLTGTITSLLRLFDSSQKKIDYAREVDELFSAVMASISKLSEEQQAPFWLEIKKPKWGMVPQ